MYMHGTKDQISNARHFDSAQTPMHCTESSANDSIKHLLGRGKLMELY
jgi:hypothetical protein